MCNSTHFYSCVHGDLYCGDSLAVLKSLPSESVHCCVTSPPYFGLRSYMPEAVTLRDDLSEEERKVIEEYLARLGVQPIFG